MCPLSRPHSSQSTFISSIKIFDILLEPLALLRNSSDPIHSRGLAGAHFFTMTDILPHNATAWRTAAKKHSIKASWIEVQTSGSGVAFPDFLTLRATWPRKIIPAAGLDDRKLMAPELQRKLDEAVYYLSSDNEWLMYLKSLDSQSSGQASRSSVNLRGTYALVRYYQYLSSQKKDGVDTNWDVISPKVSSFTRSRYREDPQVTPTPAGRPVPDAEAEHFLGAIEGLDLQTPTSQGLKTPASKAPSSRSILTPYTPLQSFGASEEEAVEDEQIINTALVLFLNALTLHCPKVSDHWSLYRKPFTYRDARGAKVYEARVDGLLRSEDKIPKILVEVKPCHRCAGSKQGKKGPPKAKIRMQETAQMVAWIYESHKPDSKAPPPMQIFRKPAQPSQTQQQPPRPSRGQAQPTNPGLPREVPPQAAETPKYRYDSSSPIS